MKIFREIREDYINSCYEKKIVLIMGIYRIGNAIYESKINNILKSIFLIPFKILNKLIIGIIFNSQIPFSCSIGGGIRLVHFNGIIIHPNTKIGKNCTIFHQVTIGANEHQKNYKNAPKIGDYVYIGAGAKIIGDISIGDYSRVGVNAVVYKTIENNTTVVSVQRNIIRTSMKGLNYD